VTELFLPTPFCLGEVDKDTFNKLGAYFNDGVRVSNGDFGWVDECVSDMIEPLAKSLPRQAVPVLIDHFVLLKYICKPDLPVNHYAQTWHIDRGRSGNHKVIVTSALPTEVLSGPIETERLTKLLGEKVLEGELNPTNNLDKPISRLQLNVTLTDL
jgi:hypothetical protein